MPLPNGITILTPGGGRDYKSAGAAGKDYFAGKDFIHNAYNKPCSIRDFPGEQVKIRYNKLQDSCYVGGE